MMDREKNKNVGKVSEEKLKHYNCGKCKAWWTIGDARSPKIMFCPHCGLKQSFEKV